MTIEEIIIRKRLELARKLLGLVPLESWPKAPAIFEIHGARKGKES